MSEFTVEDLGRVLREAAGDSEVAVGGDSLDTDFAEIGYDSIALLEAAGRIERQLGIQLDDETVGEATTPRLFLAVVNRQGSADAA
ncbi:acyl carrier protein [Actinomadura litoris]|uniref:acyl carrier protein n=1 Tax=Actinomadura litoris TaxID=2678616 RepID=UPI001FA79B48|nr:acyl carrier protein [Actinomadura litoris]